MDNIYEQFKAKSKFLKLCEAYTNMSGQPTMDGARPGALPGTAPVIPEVLAAGPGPGIVSPAGPSATSANKQQPNGQSPETTAAQQASVKMAQQAAHLKLKDLDKQKQAYQAFLSGQGPDPDAPVTSHTGQYNNPAAGATVATTV